MNKLIKKLYLQADFPKFDIENEAERFAELIIEECRTVINDLYHKMPLQLAVVLIDADNEIMKHFYGVEDES